MKDGHELTTVKQCKPGEYIRLAINGPVWIRGEYDRSTKTFIVWKFDDVNHCANWKPTRPVYVGFSF